LVARIVTFNKPQRGFGWTLFYDILANGIRTDRHHILSCRITCMIFQGYDEMIAFDLDFDIHQFGKSTGLSDDFFQLVNLWKEPSYKESQIGYILEFENRATLYAL